MFATEHIPDLEYDSEDGDSDIRVYPQENADGQHVYSNVAPQMVKKFFPNVALQIS